MNGAEIRTHSALHVLKGAIHRTLGATWTASTYVSGDHGRLTVQYNRKPRAEEVRKLEEETNRAIGENMELIEFEMEREEAERHFGKEIYDLFPVPGEIRRLKIVRIPDWEVNCCVEKHVEYTFEIGKIVVDGVRFRPKKQLLEVEFHL